MRVLDAHCQCFVREQPSLARRVGVVMEGPSLARRVGVKTCTLTRRASEGNDGKRWLQNPKQPGCRMLLWHSEISVEHGSERPRQRGAQCYLTREPGES
jgi:hypothetical protein